MISNKFLSELVKILGPKNVVNDAGGLMSYSYDASIEESLPEAVVFPDSTEEISRIVKLCNKHRVTFVARGGGTSYSGGPVPVKGGIVVNLLRMNRILEIDKENRFIVVEPGVVNSDINKCLEKCGLRYLPDPASSDTATIGGNVAENCGGPHCLGHGVTTTHLLGMEVVLPNGDIASFGSNTRDYCSINLSSLLCGSEGTLGIITKIILEVDPQPKVSKSFYVEFDDTVDCAKTVSELVSIITRAVAIEMMVAPIIKREEKTFKPEKPILLVDIESDEDEFKTIFDRFRKICKSNNARKIKVFSKKFEVMRDEIIRKRMKKLVKLTNKPRYFLVDAVVPRKKLPVILPKIEAVAKKYSLSMRNNFHAGDGNLHPAFFYDPENKEEKDCLWKAIREVIEECIRQGGTLSGEHGIGLEKKDMMHLVFSNYEIILHKDIKEVFDCGYLCNPDKVF